MTNSKKNHAVAVLGSILLIIAFVFNTVSADVTELNDPNGYCTTYDTAILYPPNNTLSVLQSAFEGSHENYEGENAIDLQSNSGDGWKLSFPVKVVDYDDLNHAVVFESINEVLLANGNVSKICISFCHSDNISEQIDAKNTGRVYEPGEIIYRTGNYGESYGSHLHLSCRVGIWHNNKNGKNPKYNGNIYVSDCLFIPTSATISNDGGLIWARYGTDITLIDEGYYSIGSSSILVDGGIYRIRLANTSLYLAPESTASNATVILSESNNSSVNIMNPQLPDYSDCWIADFNGICWKLINLQTGYTLTTTNKKPDSYQDVVVGTRSADYKSQDLYVKPYTGDTFVLQIGNAGRNCCSPYSVYLSCDDNAVIGSNCYLDSVCSSPTLFQFEYTNVYLDEYR